MDDNKKQVQIINMHGSTMMSVDKVKLKGDDIAMVGNIMGTMPGTFYISPENLWKMVRMLNISILFAMPGLLFKGMRASKRNQKASEKS